MNHPAGLPPELAALTRPLVVSVLNVTPDSFSDGGRFLDPAAAVAQGMSQVQAGADIIDVGGESTRPGAARIPVAEELRRVRPVVAGLSARGVPVSIDTMNALTAQAAVADGAVLVNDVSGGLADPDMYPWLATSSVPYVAMHWRGHSAQMDSLSQYGDVVRDVRDELAARLEALTAAGVAPQRVVLDPGLGFAKDAGHNWALLAALPVLSALGRPILVGASRKRFLGSLLADPDGPRPVVARDAATDAVTTLAAFHGAWAVRVHDVRGSRDAICVALAWARAGALATTAPDHRGEHSDSRRNP